MSITTRRFVSSFSLLSIPSASLGPYSTLPYHHALAVIPVLISLIEFRPLSM